VDEGAVRAGGRIDPNATDELGMFALDGLSGVDVQSSAVGVIVVAALVFFQFYWFATGTVATLVVMRVRGRDWVENKDLAWTAWASAALPEFLGIIEFFRR